MYLETSILQKIKMPAFQFVFMIGIVNLFAEMTYEGGAAMNGQFMGLLGASALTVSIVAGMGEFFGFIIRTISGYLGDKIAKPWLIAFIGYGLNLFAIPFMVFVDDWQLAAILIFAERIGRAIRKPTIESMLSYTTKKLGSGWVYALNTALSDIGATISPLLMALVLFHKKNYQIAYAFLFISSLCALSVLSLTQRKFSNPSELEKGGESTANLKTFTPPYWLYMLAGAFFASGLMSYELVAFHLAKTNTIKISSIPLFLALSTFFSIIASLILGKLYDKIGLKIVLFGIVISACFSPIVFLDGFWGALFGMGIWGLAYAIQDSSLKAIIVNLLPAGKRGLGFGLFYTGYGTGWLLGSIIMGLLYDYSHNIMIIYIITMQLISVPIFLFAKKAENKITQNS